MSMAPLTKYFKGVVAKRLSAVEADQGRSHQHEFNGTIALKELFGLDRQEREALLLYLSDVDTPVHAKCNLTWYDARENHATRSEHRLYFTPNEVMDAAEESDLFLLCVQSDDSLLAIVAPCGSTQANQLAWLFSLDLPSESPFAASGLPDHVMSGSLLLRTQILDAIGVDDAGDWVQDKYMGMLAERFPGGLPSTMEFSQFARESVEIQHESPDDLLLSWMEHEEVLFRTYERSILREKLDEGFSDVDEFISIALSVLNRRKSRAGHALENHLQEIFVREGLRFKRGGHTENRAKPDFLFPSEEEYHQADFPAALLTMLGAKTTCKDRWRQVLVEAERIPQKHLATLEPGISETQTQEMASQSLTLVVPTSIQQTYSPSQRSRLLSLGSFIDMVLARQNERP
jgi:hypothetical protein